MNSFIVLDPTAPEKREIVYHKSYPAQSKNAVINSEGDNGIQRMGLLFLGLKDLINQVTLGDFIKSAYFSGHESDKYKVVYSFQLAGLICVLATQMVDIPSKALHTLLENTLSIIPFIWKDFTNVIKERSVNDELDKIVLNMMEILSIAEKRFLNVLGNTSVPFVWIEETNSLLVSDLLSSIEAYLPGYWTPTETLTHTHTVYSTIFYLNNMVVHSHMEKTDAVLVTRLCELRGYLSRTKDHAELLAWESVYKDTDFTEKKQKFTLFVMCQEEFVLAALLQPFFSSDNNDSNSNPSPLLVDRLRISFNKLRAAGIISHIREKASQHMSPIALISEKSVLKGSTPFVVLSGQDGKNILFEYVSYNRLSGAILTPNKLKQDDQVAHDLIHLKFYNSILTIQTILHSKHYQKHGIEEYAIRLQSQSPNPSNSNFSNIFSLANTINNNTTTQQLSKGFWVVGRLYQNNEFYVCYHDDVPRDTVEMAFRLLFL
eukprot:TRINITY_DN3792_c0_g1_i2.p1 TRINITY_DN3792_c0_g1~~TRINITY_DN3792_c0_g1_i2.p1  ORF type:complete len:488 (-),score=81.65 TRINITY_DN3792_c0_g1_i2:47-1510(-)